jgi:uncharacterized cupin superfamily protein
LVENTGATHVTVDRRQLCHLVAGHIVLEPEAMKQLHWMVVFSVLLIGDSSAAVTKKKKLVSGTKV